MNLVDAAKYGAVGVACSVGAVVGLSVASSVVPTPYGPTPKVITPEAIDFTVLAVCIAAIPFFVLYGLVLGLIQSRAGARIPSRSRLAAIGFCAASVQAAGAFATDAFTKTPMGWNLDQTISIPLFIAGTTLPGLIAGIVLLKR